MHEPPVRACFRVLAVARPVDPVAFTRVILDPEVIPDRGELRVALPPLAEDALRSVRPPDSAAHAAPGEGDGRVVRKERHRLDRFGPGKQAGRPPPPDRARRTQ